MKPLERFYNLLELDKKDVYQLFFTESCQSNQFITLGNQAITNFIQSGSKCLWIVLIVLVVLSGTSWNFSFDAIAHHGKSATKNIYSFLI
jgi:hypothetical protein